ncbi:MAG: N-carbamoylputrescine amidase, partial [Deltaproteobacteria bacterium]|nr:N-carbamoylputrescine amidase [Deltaproteobacteria bacterium]
MTASSLSIGIVQCALGDAREANVTRVEGLIREAALRGAKIIVTPELFEGPYFPQTEDEHAFDLAAPLDSHPTVGRMQALAEELGVVLPISFFERAGQAYYNSVVTIDADGKLLGAYRKSHIPDGPGYEEKFYFRPGDTGFRVWNTRHGNVGVGICWDQWFPEAARSMALQGAEALLYPTAIGSEP